MVKTTVGELLAQAYARALTPQEPKETLPLEAYEELSAENGEEGNGEEHPAVIAHESWEAYCKEVKELCGEKNLSAKHLTLEVMAANAATGLIEHGRFLDTLKIEDGERWWIHEESSEAARRLMIEQIRENQNDQTGETAVEA